VFIVVGTGRGAGPPLMGLLVATHRHHPVRARDGGPRADTRRLAERVMSVPYRQPMRPSTGRAGPARSSRFSASVSAPSSRRSRRPVRLRPIGTCALPVDDVASFTRTAWIVTSSCSSR
jgi:hypothetical protein